MTNAEQTEAGAEIEADRSRYVEASEANIDLIRASVLTFQAKARFWNRFGAAIVILALGAVAIAGVVVS